jgi:hypothetical protein
VQIRYANSRQILCYIVNFASVSARPRLKPIGDLRKCGAASFFHTDKPEPSAVIAIPIEVMDEFIQKLIVELLCHCPPCTEHFAYLPLHRRWVGVLYFSSNGKLGRITPDGAPVSGR